MRRTAPPRIALPLLALIGFGICGCSDLETEYGKSTGRSGKTSINGFGGLRTLYEMQGWESRTISRVGPRLDNLDSIVWTPSANTPIAGEVSQWFDSWLGRGGKTLVYLVYDGGSEADYWRRAARFASPSQRLEYRRRAARAELERLRQFLRQPVPQSNGWFEIRKRDHPQPIGRLSGPWTRPGDRGPAVASGGGGASGDGASGRWIRFQIQPVDDLPTSSPTPTVFTWPNTTVDFRSDVETQLQPLLTTEAGVPLVTRIDSSAWGQSQVLVVSAGSLLSNYGLTDQLGRRLAPRLVAASGPPGQVGFLYSDITGINVSSQIEGHAGKSGMELLTVWPLSLVTIHAALLGLVICLILMPIFGRPRNPRRFSQSDFADHLDAVAALLGRTGGDQYARQRVSEYMRHVRGETSGPWILPEPDHTPPPPAGGDRPIPPGEDR